MFNKKNIIPIIILCLIIGCSVGAEENPDKTPPVINEIKAEVSGTIIEVLVTNGQAVEYGQVLFKVKPE